MKGIFEKNDLRITAKYIKGFRGFAPMFHSHAEIIYIISGEITFVIDGKKKRLCAGDISFTFPYSIHSYDASENAEAFLLMFSPAVTPDFEGTLLSCKPESPFLKNTDCVAGLLDRIMQLNTQEDDIRRKTVKGYICAAVGELFMQMHLRSIENTDINTVQKILIYCAEHFRENISVSEISEKLFVSKSHVTGVFSSRLGCSFRSYINTLRINEAKALLKNSDMKIIDIMLECGFENQSSFNRTFCEMCGETPSAYRKRINCR